MMVLGAAACHLVRDRCCVLKKHSAAVSHAVGLYRGVRANTEQTCLVRRPFLVPVISRTATSLYPLLGGRGRGSIQVACSRIRSGDRTLLSDEEVFEA
jgi:hypothetical protein